MTIGHLHPPLALDNACDQGLMCASERPGHALSLIQLRASSATPSKWCDAVVTAVANDGSAVLTPLFEGVELTVWHHANLGDAFAVGDPVALHCLYGVLAFGTHRFSVVVN